MYDISYCICIRTVKLMTKVTDLYIYQTKILKIFVKSIKAVSITSCPVTFNEYMKIGNLRDIVKYENN